MEVHINEAVAIAEGVYWVGSSVSSHTLHSNSYLLVDSEEGILVDPGSPEDFEEVYRKVVSILPVEQISTIILLHQDPNAASSTPLFEAKGFSGKIATHWRTALFAVYYGITSPFFYVNENDYELVFGNDRLIRFIPAPYLHFPGAVMAHDIHSGLLFSGDLFSSISRDWKLFAEETYKEGMKTFHEHYMPSREILRPVMEVLLQRDISMICPQHGSIIDREVREYIKVLRDLECGVLLNPIRRDLISHGGYAYLMGQVVQRLVSGFGLEEVLKAFDESPFVLDETNGEPKEFRGRAEELWNRFFDIIYAYGGSRWLTLIEPLLQRFEQEYGVTRPSIYLGELARQKRRAIGLQEEKERLEKVNTNLRSTLELTQEEMTRDSVTGLYNEDFLVRYLLNIFGEEKWSSFTALFVQIDDMKRINDSIGENEGDEIISGVGKVLFQMKEEGDYLFRISGPIFVLVLPEQEAGKVENRAEDIRGAVEDNRGFIEKVTVTVAVVPVRFEDLGMIPAVVAMNQTFGEGRSMLRLSLREGGNRVILDRGEGKRLGLEGRVLIAEYDRFHAELVKDSLVRLSIDVRVIMSGPEIVPMVAEFHPDVIISELFLPEEDAFSIREALQENSKTKDIPFILVSHQKNESTVVRALNLGIAHYLKKPYMLPELLGIVNTCVERALRYGT